MRCIGNEGQKVNQYKMVIFKNRLVGDDWKIFLLSFVQGEPAEMVCVLKESDQKRGERVKNQPRGNLLSSKRIRGKKKLV